MNASNDNTSQLLIIITVMLVAILEVLDSTIVNVALPYMMPSLGANQDQVTWVLTSYVVASAMMLPLTGFISRWLGQKRLLLVSVVGFMLSSLCCGTATSLDIMVTFRLLQGAFGAAMIPLSQAILRETFPKNQQGKAMAIWAIGVMTAPVLGPTLGGFITEHASWRWVFYINLPVCIVGFLLTVLCIPASKGERQKLDYLGVLLMFVGVGSLQVFLDQGNTQDWFNSSLIIILAITSAVCLTFFIIRSLTHKTPAVKLKIFKDRNFMICSIALAVYSGAVFGLITLEPLMLETLFGYTALNAGIVMAPMGITSALTMMLIANLVNKISPKTLISIALLGCSFAAALFSHMNTSISENTLLIANAALGIGMGLFMVPLSTYALMTLNKQDITEGSGLFSYSRMLGSSIGISLLSTLVSRLTQKNWNQLSGHVNRFSSNVTQWLGQSHMSLQNPQTLPILQNQLAKQAGMIAFSSTYHLTAIILLLVIPVVWFMHAVDIEQASLEAH